MRQLSPPLALGPQLTGSSPQPRRADLPPAGDGQPAAGILESLASPNVPMSAEVLAELLESQGTGVDEYGHTPLAMILAELGDQVSGNRGDHGHV